MTVLVLSQALQQSCCWTYVIGATLPWQAGSKAKIWRRKVVVSKHRPCKAILVESLIAACLSLQKLICLCRSREERIRTDTYPEKSDLKEMKLSVYISGAYSDSTKIKNDFSLTETFAFFLSGRTKGTHWRERRTRADFARNKLTYHKDPTKESRKMPSHISALHLLQVWLR